MGGAEGIMADGPKLTPPPVLSVRPREKPPSSRLANWLSESGELSYELEYAAGGGSMPIGGESLVANGGICSRVPSGYEDGMPAEDGKDPPDWNGCDEERGGEESG
jgi:hypothetical protein